MKRREFVSCITVVGFASSVLTSQEGSTSGARMIHVSDLDPKNVIGLLGVHLGKIVTVEGLTADATVRIPKAYSGKTVLLVAKVNDNLLKEPVMFPYGPSVAPGITRPRPGERFRFVGYETGRFVGSVEESELVVATQRFHFASELVILENKR